MPAFVQVIFKRPTRARGVCLMHDPRATARRPPPPPRRPTVGVIRPRVRLKRLSRLLAALHMALLRLSEAPAPTALLTQLRDCGTSFRLEFRTLLPPQMTVVPTCCGACHVLLATLNRLRPLALEARLGDLAQECDRAQSGTFF
jgi:hypothetical protein